MFYTETLGTTDETLHLWKALRGFYRTGFSEVFCGSAAIGFTGSVSSRYGPSTLEPTMVLRSAPDEDGLQLDLWLDGLTVGYIGTGPAATAHVLLSEGFSPDLVDLVPLYAGLHLVKGEAVPRIMLDVLPENGGPPSRDGDSFAAYIIQLQNEGHF